MIIDKVIQRCIETWIDDIENEKYDIFFNNCLTVEQLSQLQFMDLVNVLNDVGIDTTSTREEMLILALDNWIEEVDDWQYLDDILDAASSGGCFAVNNFDRRCQLAKEWADKRDDIEYSGYGTSEFQLMYNGD